MKWLSIRPNAVGTLLALASVAASITGTLPATAEQDAYCSDFIETTFVEKLVAHCQPGDVLQLQLALSVGPSGVIGRLCDLTHTVWTEATEGHVFLVCVYKPKEARQQ